jgi:hypothetical protein
MPYATPFLAQASERPRGLPLVPALQIGSDGLLRCEGSKRPFIDELIDSKVAGDDDSLSLMITDVKWASPDPDLVRAGVPSEYDCPAAMLESLITKAPGEPDPDVFRATCSALDTTFTKAQYDQPDPDGFRQERFQRW